MKKCENRERAKVKEDKHSDNKTEESKKERKEKIRYDNQGENRKMEIKAAEI